MNDRRQEREVRAGETSALGSGLLHFEGFTYDASLRELRRANDTIALQPTPLRLLEYLLQHRGRLITKEELLDSVWPDTAVSETALSSALRDLRRALGESGTAPRFVETRRGQGYVVVAAVREEAAEASTAVAPRSGVFVGRGRILGELGAALNDALSGNGRVALLAGEPGIGKTRTLDHFERMVRDRDVSVARAWCSELAGAPPYWPWVQLLRDVVAQCDPRHVRSALGPAAADLAGWLPELADDRAGVQPRVSSDSEVERFRLFQSVSSVLDRLTARRGVVLLVDDLHDADSSSLRLLEFVAHSVSRARLLIVGTYRDVGAANPDRLVQTLAQLARHDAFRRLALEGLQRSEIADLLRALSGIDPAAQLVERMEAKTDGNPFFIRELFTFLRDDGVERFGGSETLQIPVGLREVVRGRLRQLGGDTDAVLEALAIIADGAPPALVAAVCGLEEGRVLEALEAARAAGLLSDGRTDHYRFAHEVIREVVYADQSPPRRAALHQRVGELLEGDRDASLAILARHFSEAAESGAAVQAYDYATRAGRRALELLAFDDAARHFEQALGIKASADATARCDLLRELGAAHMQAGHRSAGRDAFREAFEIARKIDDPERLAEAAHGFAGRPALTAAASTAATLLEEALADLPRTDTPLRIGLLIRLAGHTVVPAHFERARALLTEAHERAQRLADDATTAAVLDVQSWLMWPDASPADRETVARKAVEAARRAGDSFTAAHGHFAWIRAQLEQGQIAAADENSLRLEAHIDEHRLAFVQHHLIGYRACRAHMRGRLREAENLGGQALRGATQVEYEGALIPFGALMGLIRIEQGRLAELQELGRTLVREHPEIRGIRSGLAVLLARTGARDEALRILEELAEDQFEPLRADPEWRVAEACVLLQRPDLGVRIRAHFEPYAEGHIVMGAAQVYLGPVAYYLGLLAGAAGDHEKAAEYFADAARRGESAGTPLWTARALLGRARCLAAQNGRAVRRGAGELLEAARLRVRELEAWGLASEIEAARAQLAATDPRSG